jgi:uncharacterized membrane protein YfcA
MIALPFAAAGLGDLAVAVAPTPMLSATMPALLIVMAIYFTFSPRLSDADAQAPHNNQRLLVDGRTFHWLL